MNSERLEELLTHWQEDQLSSEQSVELHELLKNKAAREQLVEFFMLTQALSENQARQKKLSPSARLDAQKILELRPHPSARQSKVIKGSVRKSRMRKILRTDGNAWMGWAAGIAAMLALCVGLYLTKKPATPDAPVVAILQTVEGSCRILDDKNSGDANTGSVWRVGQTLEISMDSIAEMRLTDGSRVRLEPGSQVKAIALKSPGLVLHLLKGTLQGQVEHQHDPMKIRTPSAEIDILGTRFTIEAEANSARLDVDEGKVKLTRLADQASVVVTKDEFVEAKAAEPLTVKKVEAPTPVFVWWEGEKSVSHNYNMHMWLNKEVDQTPLSNKKWLCNLNKAKETGSNRLYAKWLVKVPVNDSYTLWVREFTRAVSAPWRYRWDDGPWIEAPSSQPMLDWNEVMIGHRADIGWCPFENQKLTTGTHTLTINADLHPVREVSTFDCFLLTNRPFTPNGKTKPPELQK